MAQNKTAETNVNVVDFINSIENEVRRNDAFRLIEAQKEIDVLREIIAASFKQAQKL